MFIMQIGTVPQSAPIYGFLDIPAKNALVTPHVYFAGWAFNANTGRPPAVIQLWRRNLLGGGIHPVEVTRHFVSRPDVQAVYLPHVPNLVLECGYHLYPQTPQEAGQWEYQLLFADAPHSMQSGSIINTVTIQ